MLNGKELGLAIANAISLKESSGAISSKADVARHFGIKTPSIYDWIKKGSISKDKLPELWSYFSDVVGPEHWGLDGWPGREEAKQPSRDKSTANSKKPKLVLAETPTEPLTDEERIMLKGFRDASVEGKGTMLMLAKAASEAKAAFLKRSG